SQPWHTLWGVVTASTWEDGREKVLESLGMAHQNRGNLKQTRGEVQLAREDYSKAEALFTGLVRANPAEPRLRYRLAISHNALGFNWFVDDSGASLKKFEQGIRLLTPLVKDHGAVAY